MIEAYRDDWTTIINGEAMEELKSMEADTVNCVVTSPPYW